MALFCDYQHATFYNYKDKCELPWNIISLLFVVVVRERKSK